VYLYFSALENKFLFSNLFYIRDVPISPEPTREPLPNPQLLQQTYAKSIISTMEPIFAKLGDY
jgi:hypothetical protein